MGVDFSIYFWFRFFFLFLFLFLFFSSLYDLFSSLCGEKYTYKIYGRMQRIG